MKHKQQENSHLLKDKKRNRIKSEPMWKLKVLISEQILYAKKQCLRIDLCYVIFSSSVLYF